MISSSWMLWICHFSAASSCKLLENLICFSLIIFLSKCDFCFSSSLPCILPAYTLFFLNLRSLVVEARTKQAPVGFLDPESLNSTMITHSRSFCVDYMIRAYQLYAKKRMIMFVHNTGGHWIAVVILLRHTRVLYFDSLRSCPKL